MMHACSYLPGERGYASNGAPFYRRQIRIRFSLIGIPTSNYSIVTIATLTDNLARRKNDFQERPERFRSGLMAILVGIEKLENEVDNKVITDDMKMSFLDGL